MGDYFQCMPSVNTLKSLEGQHVFQLIGLVYLEKGNNSVLCKFIEYLKEKLPNPATHKMYFEYGTLGFDASYEPFQLMVDSVLRESGYNEINWIANKFIGDDHSKKS